MGSPSEVPAGFVKSPHLDGPPIHLGGAVLGAQRHICAFFNSREDDYRVTLPFIKEGLDRGNKAFHVVDAARRLDHLQRMTSAGIDAEAALRSGQFELLGWEATYLSYTHFEPIEHLAYAERYMQKARGDGYPICRVIAHMDWVVEHQVDIDLLLEYEARTNYIWGNYPDPVICTYDLSKFRGDVVVDVLRTHPMAIIGGILQENPFYVPPDEFLRELRERRAARTQ